MLSDTASSSKDQIQPFFHFFYIFFYRYLHWDTFHTVSKDVQTFTIYYIYIIYIYMYIYIYDIYMYIYIYIFILGPPFTAYMYGDLRRYIILPC